jgi:hypothetical protein
MNDLASLLDAPDAFDRMRALPSFQGRPAWARFDHDAAIGNFAAALGHGDRVACARVAVAATRAAFTHFGLQDQSRAIGLAFIALEGLEHWAMHPLEAWRKHMPAVELDGSLVEEVVHAWIIDATAHAYESVVAAPTTNAVLAAICAVRALIAGGVATQTATLAIARACTRPQVPPHELIDLHDAFDAMRALPPFEPTEWTGRPEDAAIGNWTLAVVGDHESCVRAALAAVRAIRERMPDAPIEELAVDPAWIDDQVRVIEDWLDHLDAPHAEMASMTIDVTRQTSAWRDFDVVDGWIGEAADFAIQAVNVPTALARLGRLREPTTFAVLAAICAVRALVCDGLAPRIAVLEIARAIRDELGRTR